MRGGKIVAVVTSLSVVFLASISSAGAQGTGGIGLTSASCATTTSCVGVGVVHNSQTSFRTLAEQKNGGIWTVTPSPSPGTDSFLSGVSCVTTKSCVAVGGHDNGTGEDTLVESWNGTTWTITPSPNPNNAASLNGVSCVSTHWCVAVGGYEVMPCKYSLGRTLIETWNGTKWSIVSSPNTNSTCDATTVLQEVSCLSPNFCAAVGYNRDEVSDVGRTITEMWNGSKWTLVASPNPAGGNSTIFPDLKSVSCVASTDCFAVGNTRNPGDGAPGDATFIEHWNGTTWAMSPSPNPNNSTNDSDQLNGVSCATTSVCIAVGHVLNQHTQTETVLIERWDGNDWSIGLNHSSGSLSGVSCPSTTTCVVVGTINSFVVSGST